MGYQHFREMLLPRDSCRISLEKMSLDRVRHYTGLQDVPWFVNDYQTPGSFNEHVAYDLSWPKEVRTSHAHTNPLAA